MTRAEVTSWVEGYIRAWRSPGTAQLAQLFTADARYLPSPWRKPIQGLDAIATFWEDARESPNEQFTITHEVAAVEGRTAVIRLGVQYAEPPTEWRDLWIIQFSNDGKAQLFEEWPFRPGQDDGHQQELDS